MSNNMKIIRPRKFSVQTPPGIPLTIIWPLHSLWSTFLLHSFFKSSSGETAAAIGGEAGRWHDALLESLFRILLKISHWDLVWYVWYVRNPSKIVQEDFNHVTWSARGILCILGWTFSPNNFSLPFVTTKAQKFSFTNVLPQKLVRCWFCVLKFQNPWDCDALQWSSWCHFPVQGPNDDAQIY